MKKELYKTELCRHYVNQKRCPYRDKCQFAHGSEELVDAVRHPKYKTQPCRSYHTKGFCTYGPRCHFVHGRTYEDDSPKAAFSKSLERSCSDREKTEAKEETAETHAQKRKFSGRYEAERCESNGSSDVCSKRSDCVPTSLEMFQEISKECRRRVQETRERCRERNRESTDHRDLEARSSYLQRSQKSADQPSGDEDAVYHRVRYEIEGVTRKFCHFRLVDVTESSSGDNRHSSPTHHYYQNSFFRAGISAIRQKPKPPTTQSDDSANAYNAPNSRERRTFCYKRYNESLNPLFKVETLRQHVPPTAGTKSWNQGIGDICPSLPTETQNVGGRPCSFRLSSLSTGLLDGSRGKPPSRI